MQEGAMDKVQAWDTSSRSEDSFDQELTIRELDSDGRSRCLQGASQFGLAAQAVALALFASHADGAEHAIFYVCDACIVLLFIAYSVLRCAGYIGPASAAPVCAVFAWALSLLLSLSAPGRRRRLLGLEDGGSAEPCEEGSVALWIALLLSLLPVLARMPTVPFALLGQLVSVQHLVIGLVLPRQECMHIAGGPGGATLGLPPIWISALQLSALSALSVVAHGRLERHRQAETIISRFLSTRNPHCFSDDSASPQLAQNRLERIVRELEKEEKDCRRLVRDLDDVLRVSVANMSERVWASLPLHVAGMLKHCSGQLKRHNVDGDNATDQLFRAMERSIDRRSTMELGAVSGWLEHPQGFNSRRRRSSIARSEHATLTAVDEEEGNRKHILERNISFMGVSIDWCIGEWSFDALKCEQEHRHVLQTVGYELLRNYSVLPRTQLGLFLERLERTYMAGNPYHSHVHGADMTNTLYFLITKSGLWDLAEIADSTRAATLIAALGHDVGHFGRNNVFLMTTRHTLAVTYNDRSILENFHSATLMRLLDDEYGEGDEKKKLLSSFSADHMQKARQLMISLILATDPQKHLEDLSAFRLRMGSHSFDPTSDDTDQQTTLSMLVRAADIGHSMKEWALHQEWSRRAVQEFHAQGDEEKFLGLKVSPLCEREGFQLASSQVGFLQFICLPTWTELANFESKVKEHSHSASYHTPSTRRRSARLGSANSNASSVRSPSSRVHTPRGSAREETASPTLQRRGSIGHAIGMLGARSPIKGPGPRTDCSTPPRSTHFLLLPGSIPTGTPSNKVVPAVPDEVVPPPQRALRDVCLASCEKNCSNWKHMATHSMTTESLNTNPEMQRDGTDPGSPGPEVQAAKSGSDSGL